MRRPSGVKVLLLALALLCRTPVAVRAQEAAGAESKEARLARILERAGERVESYHRGLFSIAFNEALRHEELRKDMTAKKSKEFVFETVVTREAVPGGDDDYYPKTVRRLKSVDGKPPKKGAAAPSEFAVASLNFLLPKNRKPSDEFTLEGEETVGGRTCFRVRMLRQGQGPPSVEFKRSWRGGRFLVHAPRVMLLWIDAETFDVLRLESHLAAPFEFDSPRTFGSFGPSRHLKYAAQDYSVSFRRQQFQGPEQTLLVPESAEIVRVIEGASKPRLRSTLRLSDYRRFRSDVNVIDEPDGQGSRQ